jgi:hypothetical protein
MGDIARELSTTLVPATKMQKKIRQNESFPNVHFPAKKATLLYAQVVGVLRSYPGHDSEEFSHSDYDIKVSKLIFVCYFFT